MLVERAAMSIINKMHQDFQKNQQTQPILGVMPVKKNRQKVFIFVLIVLLLGSSLGLSYLIFSQHKTVKESSSLAIKKEKTPAQLVVAAPKVIAAPIVAGPKLSSRPTLEDPIKAPEVIAAPIVVGPKVSSRPTLEDPITAPEVVEAVAEQPAKTVAPETLAPVDQIALEKKEVEIVSPKKVAEKVRKTEAIPLIKKPPNSESHLSITASQLSKKELAQLHLKEAYKAKFEGDFKLVSEKKQQALALLPGLNEVRKSLALYYYGQGAVEIAQRLLKQGATVSPDYPDFNLMLSRIALKAGDQKKAYLYLEQHPPEVAGNLDYYASHAILAQKFKKYEQSERLYTRLLSQRPNNGRWRMSLAIVQDRQDKRALAVNSYKNALLQTDLSVNAKAYIKQRLSYLGEK